MIQTNQVLFIEKLKVVPNSSILELHMQDVCNLIVYVFECRNHISISTHEDKGFFKTEESFTMATSVPDGSRRNPANCNNKRVYWNGIPRRECYPRI